MKRFTVAVALAAAVTVLLSAVTVRADGDGSYIPDPDAPTATGVIEVVGGPDGVTIFISLTSAQPGSPGAAPTTEVVTGPVQPICSATPINLGNSSPTWIREGVLLNPGTTPWGVSCSDGSFAVAWVPVDAPGAPDIVVTDPGAPPVDPAALASAVLGVVPLPAVTLGVSPSVGLVALPSWFWIDGYGGASLAGSRTLGGITVDVEVIPRAYRWDFGDGSNLTTTSLGQPYPTESDVQHVYETAAPAGVPLRLEITWDARYRVNGGAWIPLAPVTRVYQQRYPVAQLQSVLTSR